MLQTDNTGVRSKCLGHTGSAPAHGACNLPAHTAWALGCSAGNNQRPALGWAPRSKPLRFRHSGSPQRRRLGWACVLCSSQVEQLRRWGAWRAPMLRLIASPPLSYLGVKPAHLLRQLLLKSWAAFLGAWCPLPAFRSCFVEFTRRLNALLMKLWGRKCSPRPTPPPSWLLQGFDLDHIWMI